MLLLTTIYKVTMIHCGAEIALKKNSLSNLYVIHDFMIVNKTKAHFTYDDIY